ncbi:PilN domain-containing protein [Aestuariibacter sp. AA17]|uniref:PilN domain-containing protein n=1 Tax=Fluctibacter corallii TaxID=2984329 RepID=A0ABT3A6S4_9ALTE|nr:PilN domain-containing protein [Aestuariibacter sp. AA17]MCV2884380.1 PilN domain-containing protein [Aestuariibacter sp. AA17]
MSHINLLSWREQLRARQKQHYLLILGLVALSSFGLMFAVSEIIDTLIINQEERNAYLSREILVLDKQIEQIRDIREKKDAIEQRMALIEQLQASRNVAPKVFDELAKIVPPGVSFRSLSRKGNRIELEGTSESNNRLSDFMRNIQQSPVFINEELSSIVADTSASDAVSDFKITFNISPSVAPEFTPIESEKAK